MKYKIYLLVFGLLLIHLFLLTNLRFTAWPEMLSYPYLRNHGYLLYKDMIHPYPPVLTMVLSIVYRLFGYKLVVLKIVAWLMILVSDVLIFSIVRFATKSIKYSLAGLLLYIFVQPFLEGNMLWFDLAIVPAILFGILFLLKKRYFWSGVFLGIAVLTKQTTLLFLMIGVFYVFIQERKFRPILHLLIGPVSLASILVVRLITEGVLSGFLNWTLVYPFTFWSKFPGYVQMALTGRQVMTLFLLSLPMFLLLMRRRFLLLVFSFLISLVMIYPRFSFFHFQTGIAFFAIIFAVFLSNLKSRRLRAAFEIIYLVFALMLVKQGVRADWHGETRFWGATEVKSAALIDGFTKPGDLVYLLGPQSGLYVLANRLPPKPWSDNFGWYLEVPGVQEEIIKGWKMNKPSVVFTLAPTSGNWFDLGTYRPQKIVNWVREEKINENRLP